MTPQEERAERYFKAWQHGMSTPQIGKREGVSRQRIHQIIRKYYPDAPRVYTISRPHPTSVKYQQDVKRTVELAKQDNTTSQIAKIMECTTSTVLSRLKTAGCDVRRIIPSRYKKRDQWYGYYQQGYSLEQTGAHFGVSWNTVLRHFIKNGLPRRRCGGSYERSGTSQTDGS